MTDREIAERIHDAYRRLAADPGDFVTIADLTDLSGVPVGELAAMLTRMYEDQQVNMVPRTFQAVLTDRERQAAIWCGGEYKHLMSMGD
jgi:hypothetical protein